MNKKLNLIYPILLSIFIPGIGFFLKEDPSTNVKSLFVYQWVFSSIVIFSLWQFLSISFKFKAAFKQVAFLIIGTTFFLLVVGFTSYMFGLKKNFIFEVEEYFRVVILILILLTIKFNLVSQKKVNKLIVEKEQLSKENYKAQLQSLRNQMDPHFLFNSLNTLRSMVKQNNNSSEDFILNLSDYYRSTLKHSEESTLPISEELSLLNSYLLLMKRRNEQALEYKISSIKKEFSIFRIPSFALQNVVENCFKHNSMSSKKPLDIQIISTSDGYIEVRNIIQEKLTQEPTTGMGLKLLKRRYKLYGIDKGVIVSKQNSAFKVRLKLINPENEYLNS